MDDFDIDVKRKTLGYEKLTTNKSLWKSINLFLKNKGFIGNNDVTLIHINKIIINEKQN